MISPFPSSLLVLAASLSLSACDDRLRGATQFGSTIEVSPIQVVLRVGYSTALRATVRDSTGAQITSARVAWSVSPNDVVAVSHDGVLTAVGWGRAVVTASSADAYARVSVEVVSPSSAQRAVTQSDAGVDFILGPKVPLGSSPWPFFDNNLVEKATSHANAAVTAIRGSDSDAALNSVYYDLALVLYGLNARSGDPAHAQLAASVAGAWWETMPRRVGWDPADAFSVAPRNASIGGLILYAMQGGGKDPLTFSHWTAGGPGPVPMDLWQWITGYVRAHYDMWLGARLSYPGLYYGIRDGGYVLLYTAWLAQAHPDEAVRADMKQKALAAGRDYYARLQAADGGWYWRDDAVCGGCAYSQPFMVGLLLEGMIATHQLTSDPAVAKAISRGADWLWEKGYEKHAVTNLTGVNWRAMRYFVYEDGRKNDRTSGQEYGMADGAIRDARQLNPTTVHAFGYAARLTGDPKYVTQGDEIFSATFGKGQGPGADAYWGLADYQAKQFNQSYRSAARYLAWRQ